MTETIDQDSKVRQFFRKQFLRLSLVAVAVGPTAVVVVDRLAHFFFGSCIGH